MSCSDVVLACVYVVLSTKSFVSNAPTNRKNQACVGNKCECVCILLPALLRNPATDISDCTSRRYFCLRFRVVFNPNAWCKRASAFFFFPIRILFLQKLELCDERVKSKTTHKSNCTICGNCFLRIRAFFNTNVWCKCTSAFFLGSYARVISAYA